MAVFSSIDAEAMTEKEQDTEQKIKEAARRVFHKKGFAATRTREIAEEAGINLALLNYYFRSKEKLFQIIMLETMQRFFQAMAIVFLDSSTSLDEKIELVTDKYIDLVSSQPEIPMFILSEIRRNAESFHEKIPMAELITNSSFMKQFQEAYSKGEIVQINPFHLIINLMGFIAFPFLAKPMLTTVGQLSEIQFEQLLQERKKLIPIWMKSIMKP